MRPLILPILLIFAIACFVPAVQAFGPVAVRSGGSFGSQRLGDPLQLAPLESWLPTLLETGDMQAAVAVAIATARISYNLQPLGDADRDGQEDFLLQTATSEPEGEGTKRTMTVAGISGKKHTKIWDLVVPAKTYWYPIGDVNEDGVLDLVLVTETTSTTSNQAGQNGVSVSRRETTYNLKNTLLSGTDATELFSLPCTEKYVSTQARGSSPVGSATLRDFVWDACGVSLVDQGPGVDLTTMVLTDYRGPSLSLPVASAHARHSMDAIKLERYDGAGKKAWEWSLKKDFMLIDTFDRADYTGDGISDAAYWVHPAMLLSASTPAVGDYFLTPLEGEFGVVDGKTGKVAWTQPVKNAEMTEWDQAAIRGPGARDIILNQLVRPDGSVDAWQSTVTQINGATGATLFTKTFPNKLAAAFGFADVEGDGKDELALFQGVLKADPLAAPEFPEEFDFAIVKADLTLLWGPLKQTEDAGWIESADADLDGDGATDLVQSMQTEGDGGSLAIRILSGRTGMALWSYTLGQGVVGIRPIGNIDGVAGDDIAITIFDVPAKKPEKTKSASGPTAATATSAPVPGPSVAGQELNYADYRGRLEVRRGTDRELIWEKTIHDPKEVQNVTSSYIWAFVDPIPDTDGDGFPELLYNVDSPFGFIIVNGEFMASDEASLSFALLVSGADGKTLKAYPEGKGQHVARAGKAARVQIGAPNSEDSSAIPAPAGLFVLLAAMGIALARRRQA